MWAAQCTRWNRRDSGCSPKRKKKDRKSVLNTPHQVVPVRTHCHPLIGSFLIPPTTWCQCIDGGVSGCQEPARPPWHRIKAGTNAARRQSGKPKRVQAQEHPKTRPRSSRLHHWGVIGTWAFRRNFKGGNLIHMCTMKLAILYPASPPLSCKLFIALPQVCNPTTDLAPYDLFRSSPTLKCHSVLLSETAQGFDLDIWGSEGGQGMLNPCWMLLTRFHLFKFVSGRVCHCISACWYDFLCLSIRLWPKTNSICFSFAYTESSAVGFKAVGCGLMLTGGCGWAKARTSHSCP